MNRVLFLLGVCALGLLQELIAKEWTTRDGKSSVEAELVDVDGELVILKRSSDGKLFKVPFSRLSLGDVQYVREAMKAAAGDNTAETAPIAPDGLGKQRSAAVVIPSGKGPPLANADRTGWQVKPDPAAVPWSLPAKHQLRIPVPKSNGRDDVLFPLAGAPVVALGSNDRDMVRELWDLRDQRRIGVIREPIPNINQLSLSPDGQLMAAFSTGQDAKIDLWSFQTGKLAKQIDLKASFVSVYGLDFAGQDRLVASMPNEKGFVMWNALSGERLAKIDAYPTPMKDRYVISAGGSYLAFAKDTDRVDIFDTRNGVLAGDLRIDVGERWSSQIGAMAFSRDGEEFAVLLGRRENSHFLCWSMSTGELVAQHKLNDQFDLRSPASSSPARMIGIEWLPDERGWLVLGGAIVDRKRGGPIWVADSERYSLYPAYRKIVDAERMLVVSGERDTRVLELIDIPWQQIEESDRIVAMGGSVEDLGLPDVTKADWSEPRDVSLARGDGNYAPAALAPLSVAATAGKVYYDASSMARTVVFSAAEAHRVLIGGDPSDYKKRREDMVSSQAGHFADIFDLGTGQRIARFEPPFATELQDFSPSGRLGLFRDLKTKDRIDVYDLESGKHQVGFRPYLDRGERFQRQVVWAEFVDDEHVLTRSQGGELVLWALDGCRAEYLLATGPSPVFLDRGRRYFAMVNDGFVNIIEAKTGALSSQFNLPGTLRIAAASAIVFRADGGRLAVLFYQEDERRLLAWDTSNVEPICDLTLPFQSFSMSWSDPDHIVVHGTQAPRDIAKGQRLTLVNVATNRVEWNYQLALGALPTVAPEDRFWSIVADPNRRGRQLLSFDLPDPKVQEVIASTPVPKPMFGKDTRVALKVVIGGMPDELPDRREREDEFDRSLREQYTGQLTSRGITVDDSSPVVFTVSVKNLTKDEIVLLGSRYRSRDAIAFVLSTKTVHATMSVQSGNNLTLWQRDHLVDLNGIDASRRPHDMPLSTYVHLQQWQQAKQWCIEMPLPKDLYHPDVYLGLGESEISTSGIRYLRQFASPSK